MEPLETRRNLAVIDPLAGVAEPVAHVPCDVVEIDDIAPNQNSLNDSLSNARYTLTVTDTQTAIAPIQDTPPTINISSFASQTVHIHFDSADASTASEDAGTWAYPTD